MQKKNIKLAFSFIIVIAFVGLIIYSMANPRPKSNSNIINKNQLQTTTKKIMEQNTNASPNANTNPKIEADRIAKDGDILTVDYTGRLENGTIFDSNVDPKFGHVKPFTFTLGAGSVIKGWEEGFVGMKVGQEKTLVIPPDEAYGSQSIGIIPPNATLTFKVKLISIK